MPASQQPTKTTIFIWPTGFFPRRIIYLLRAKRISLTQLHERNIHLVPVQLTPKGLVSHPDFEPRPEGTLPVMRLDYTNDDRTETDVIWVRESLSILEYLDDLFPTSSGYNKLKGETPIQRARSSDILSALSDAISWGMVALAHSNPATTAWSGLREEDMAPTAAAHADRKVEGLMGKMDGWVRENMSSAGSESRSLAGPGADVTFADVALMAQVEYMREGYGIEMLEGYENLKGWWEGMRGEDWVVGRDVLMECERSGNWEGALGA